MKIKVHVDTGIVGSGQDSTIEIEDDCSDEQIEEIAREEMFNMINWGWDKVP